MSSRRAAFVLLLVAVVAVSSSVFAAADDASAVGSDSVKTNDFKDYYCNQLKDDYKIYEYLKGLDTGYIKTESGSDYYVECTVGSCYPGQDAAFASVCRAWEALKLSDPFAWITWSYDSASDAVSYVDGTTYVFHIGICSKYTRGCSDVSAAADKINGMVSGSTEALGNLVEKLGLASKNNFDAMKAINGYICGKSIYYDENADFCDSIYGALAAATADKDGNHGIVCEGYAALVQALCDKVSIPCLTVFGMSAGDESNGYHAWNIVCVGSGTNFHVYGYDATFDDTGTNETAYLLVGSLSKDNGITFSMTHQAFRFDDDFRGTGVTPYNFVSHSIEEKGYEWPKETGILDMLMDFVPWIIIALICVLLAYILWSMGKKGE